MCKCPESFRRLWRRGCPHVLRCLCAGIRNSVGITFHPVTGEMWYTSNGSDHLGGAGLLKQRPVCPIPPPDLSIPDMSLVAPFRLHHCKPERRAALVVLSIASHPQTPAAQSPFAHCR